VEEDKVEIFGGGAGSVGAAGGWMGGGGISDGSERVYGVGRGAPTESPISAPRSVLASLSKLLANLLLVATAAQTRREISTPK